MILNPSCNIDLQTYWFESCLRHFALRKFNGNETSVKCNTHGQIPRTLLLLYSQSDHQKGPI